MTVGFTLFTVLSHIGPFRCPSSGYSGPLISVVKSPPADMISCRNTATPSLRHVCRPLIKGLQIRGNTGCDEKHIATRRTEQQLSGKGGEGETERAEKGRAGGGGAGG